MGHDEVEPGHPLFGIGYSAPVERRRFTRLHDHLRSEDQAPVAEEVPVALVYNRRPHVVMMATPADLEDFAVGFSITEEIVPDPGAIGGLEVEKHAQGIEIQLTIPTEAADRLTKRDRRLIGRTGCGLCGVETIQEAVRAPRPATGRVQFAEAAVWRAGAALASCQPWNRETGALHAAAWVTADGTPAIVREDVGRHNALDKVIGALVRAGRDPAAGFLLLTSRASYELIQKAGVVGIGMVAAVSRPTGLAIRLAEANRMTLVALLRGETANVYADAGHLLP